MTSACRARLVRAVRGALDGLHHARRVDPVEPHVHCALLGGCAPEGEFVSPRHPRLSALARSQLGGVTVLLGRCGRCGEWVAFDGERLHRGV